MRRAGVVLVAAHDEAMGTGLGGRIPWESPLDLGRFRSLTLGGVCVLGRRTAAGLPGGLPLRANVVLTRDAQPLPLEAKLDFSGSWPSFASSFYSVLEHVLWAMPAVPVYACGGERVWREALDAARLLGLPCSALITQVRGDHGCDVRFPFQLERDMNWLTVHEGQWQTDPATKIEQRFVVLCDKM